jgi:hypothetical protein
MAGFLPSPQQTHLYDGALCWPTPSSAWAAEFSPGPEPHVQIAGPCPQAPPFWLSIREVVRSSSALAKTLLQREVEGGGLGEGDWDLN